MVILGRYRAEKRLKTNIYNVLMDTVRGSNFPLREFGSCVKVRGGHPGLSVPNKPTVSVDAKHHERRRIELM